MNILLGISCGLAMCMALATAARRPNLATAAGLLAALSAVAAAVVAAAGGQHLMVAVCLTCALGGAVTAIMANYPLYRRIYGWAHQRQS